MSDTALIKFLGTVFFESAVGKITFISETMCDTCLNKGVCKYKEGMIYVKVTISKYHSREDVERSLEEDGVQYNTV